MAGRRLPLLLLLAGTLRAARCCPGATDPGTDPGLAPVVAAPPGPPPPPAAAAALSALLRSLQRPARSPGPPPPAAEVRVGAAGGGPRPGSAPAVGTLRPPRSGPWRRRSDLAAAA
ncbi:unnamed protein product, partial [Bubo scandiacus]